MEIKSLLLLSSRRYHDSTRTAGEAEVAGEGGGVGVP